MSPAIFQPTRTLRGATHNKAETPTLSKNFNPRAPCGARRQGGQVADNGIGFQPTRPLRGATLPRLGGSDRTAQISTHAPLAGRDTFQARLFRHLQHFNPRAPCGARRYNRKGVYCSTIFQPTRPLRGATAIRLTNSRGKITFQPTRPLRGATHRHRPSCTILDISTHAPLAGRDFMCFDGIIKT